MRWAFLFLGACAAPVGAGEPELPYRVGVGKVEITPAHPIRLNGFGFRRAESEGVYQKIWAKALAIDDGTRSPVVLLAVDVLGIPATISDELARRLAKHGVPRERLAITATHTHTGPMLTGANPTLFGVPIPPDHQANIDRYTPVFVDKLEAAALAALRDRKPARLEWGVGTVGFAENRRTRGGPTDHDLPVLVVKDAQGHIRAVYLAYACHCVTLSHNQIGGDWAGFAAEAIEDTFADAVALVAIGAGADQNPNSGVTGDKVEVAREQGRAIAAEVKRLSQNFLAPVHGSLTCRMTTLELPLAALPTRAAWEETAKRMDAIGHHARVQLAKLDRGEKLPTSIDYPVQTWAFGDSLAMIHLPGEVVVDYALRLKRELDGRRIWVTGYANTNPCYIPSERVLKEGGYEGGGAMIYYDVPVPFAPGLEEPIVRAVKKQLGQSFAPKFDATKTGGTPPLSPQQSQATIKPKPGLRVDLVAAEPLVADPVAIAFGADGKLWVAEMADYPQGKTGQFDPGGRIVVLEDRTGDGIFDTSTVFLDNLPFPTGVLPWRKGVLICAAPDILYAEDTTGDGKADRVETLYSGFAAHNYQARVNSLQYGLDGWVYGSCGLFGGTIRCVKTGKTVALGDRDFRIQPDTGELEPTTGTTQQGRVRDDRGNWFGCDNSTLIKHYVLEDHYLRRNPFVVYPNTSVTVEPSNRLFSLKADAQRFALSGPPNTVTAACGLGIYRDELLGREYFGNAFTCEPVNLVVTRRILKPNGSTFQAQRAEDEHDREFLASTDGWHRPVHVTTGPDGALWVADMYRFLIEHPRFLPPADLATIDVRAGAGLGRIYRIRPVEKPIRQWHRLDQLDTPGLVAALDSPNGWQRDQAMMLLIWKNDPAAKEPLEALARGAKSGLTRLQALCTLGALNRATKELLTQAIQDSDAGVQRHALRLIEPHIQPADALRIAQLAAAKDSDPQVRLQLAYAFGNGHWGPEASQRFLTDLVPHCTDDPHLAAALASSLNPHNLVLVGLSLGLRPENEPPQQLLRNVFATATALDSGSQLPKLLDTLRPSGAGGFRPWQLAAVASVLDAFERQGRQWGQLAPTIRTAVEPVVAHARSVLAQESATEAAILAAIPLLGRDPTTRTADVNRLANLLGPTRPVAVQAATVTALARIVDDAVPSALVGAWGSASPALRGRILDALLARPAWHAELLAAIETNRIAPGQIDAARRQRLTDHPDAAIRTRAAKLFEAISADRQKVIADYQSALGRIGDTTRGRAVFARSCAACHALDGVGHAVGPDLAALANKSPRYLLSEILDPTRNLDSRYAEYRAVTKDERTVTGILIGETATTITLRGQQGKDETILRSDLESLRGSGKSLMPEGLEKDVSKQDMADLLAYLTAQDPPHKKLAGNDPAEITLRDNALTLPATRCFIYGRDIVFEPEFQNIGYWHGAHDYVVWKVRLDKPAEFDVYLDYACHPDAAGNTFAIDGVAPPIRGKVATTGGWDQYKLVKLGTVKLPAGVQRITVRPDGLLRSALFDLRTLYLVPIGTQPQVLRPKVDKPLSPVEMARQILDEATPPARRESLIREAVPHAAEVIRALTADLPANAPGEEYRRIPWIWRVAIAAGRTNEAKSLTAVLELSLPKPGEKLRDWQAVVLGGGVINGLSLENVWPGKRLMELIGENTDLRKRWVATLQQAQALADANSVPTGTRYDALRIVALDDWKAAQPRLVKYLSKQANAELQHGAVSGLVDCTDREAATALVAALPDLTDDNRNLAISGLLRTPERIELLLTAIETGKGRPEWLSADQRAVLLHHPDATIRKRVAKVLK